MGTGAKPILRTARWRAFASVAIALLLTACAARPLPTPTPEPTPPPLSDAPDHRLDVVSFNIKFLGHYRNRDNEGLARLLNRYELVVVQELVAPPEDVETPDHRQVRGDAEAAAFFNAMAARGFRWVLSPEPSGSSLSGATSAEWFVAFYRPNRVLPANDLANGFIASPQVGNQTFERVPYAFGFRAGEADFVLLSVHLAAAANAAGAQRRARQVSAIWRWVDNQPGPERDYIVLGDTNIQNQAELTRLTPADVTALGPFQMTNVLATRPYDQVMFRTAAGGEIEPQITVINLIDRMRPGWDSANGRYPGDPPLNRQRFEQIYSDHNPISFVIDTARSDDD